MRAVRERVRVTLAHERKVAELQMQHAGIRVQARIGDAAAIAASQMSAAACFRPQSSSSSIAWIVRPTGCGESANSARIASCDRAHAGLFLQDLGEQERCRDMGRMLADQLTQQFFCFLRSLRLPQHARKCETRYRSSADSASCAAAKTAARRRDRAAAPARARIRANRIRRDRQGRNQARACFVSAARGKRTRVLVQPRRIRVQRAR